MSIRDDMIQKVVGNPGKYSIQQLEAAMKSGSLPAYVVVPIIQDKVQQQKQMQAAMQAQQQPQQQPPIAEQIMQEAEQMGGGVEQLPSNLPQEYAGGGIVAFDEGGEVERYQNKGLVASDYEQRIREEAIRQGIDPDLMVRLAGIESSFDPNAVSPKGAAGIMQLMPGTAKGLGLSETDRFDPNKAIPAGISYFKQQQERFGGDPEKAAAAYNMGPTALTRFLEQTGGVLDRRGLNPETANYLTKLFPIGAAVAGEPQPAAAPTQAPAQEGQRPRKFLGLDVVETPEQRAASEAYRAAAQQPIVDSSTPFGRGVRSIMSSFGENQTNAELQQAVAQKFGPKASVFGGFMSQSDEERQAAQKIMENVRGMPTAELRMVLQQPTAVDAVKAIGASRVPDQAERAAIARATAQARAAQPQEKAAPAAAPGAGGPRSFSEIFEGVPAPETESPMNLFKRYVEPVGKRSEEAEKALKAETARLRGQIGGELHQELEASLRKEAEELGVDKQTARNMAIFKAGLAMMAGTSRNALENIGKGALLGAEDWQRASSEIKKAQKENQRMLAHIEAARRAEKRGDVKEQIDELQRAADRQLAMDKYLAAGAFAAGVKTEEMALDVFGKRLTSATSQFGAQEKGETSLLAAMLRGAGKEGMSEAQTAKLRGDIIQDMESKGFTLQAYRAALNNPSLTQAQADKIAADPKNTSVVQRVEQARRAEIERRLREQLGRYPETPAAQAASRNYSGFETLSVK